MTRAKLITLFVASGAITIIIAACSTRTTQPTQSSSPPVEINAPADSSNGDDLNRKGEVGQTATSIGGRMTIAWPFGPFQLMEDWTGWKDERTPGSTIPPIACGRPSTHWAAEYYARDLNQKNGLDYGIMIFSGIAGRILKAGWQNGYGYTVVVYDPTRRVAVRYAHLSYIYSAAYVGRNIPAHFFLGRTGNSGKVEGTHLHIVGYENINDYNGNPIIPTLCDSDTYACRIDFSWWNY